MKKIAVTVMIILVLMTFSTISSAYSFPILFSGWENHVDPYITDGGIWTPLGDSTVVTSPVHSGTYSAKFTSSLVASVTNSAFGAIQSIKITAYICFQTVPSTGKVDCLWIYDSHTNCEINVGARNVAGTVYLSYNDNQQGTPTTNIQVIIGHWYRVTVVGVAGTPFRYSIWIDYTQVANNLPDGGYGCASLNYVGVGGWHKSEPVTVNVDDVTVEGTPIAPFELPEYYFGGLLAIASCIGAFAVFKWKQHLSRGRIRLTRTPN